jgi:streptogramin lyase
MFHFLLVTGAVAGLIACTPVQLKKSGAYPYETINLENYDLTRISMNDTRERPDRSLPLDLTLDANGNPWVTGEFQIGIAQIDKKTKTPRYITLPNVGPIFGWSRKGRTGISTLAEDITHDASGNIWITQGGAFMKYTGDVNHSRVISINATNYEITAYSVPGDHNAVIGIMYDEEVNKIYFIESGIFNHQPKIVSFTPGNIDTSIGYDDPVGLDNLVCSSLSDSDSCYLAVEIPFRTPARLVKGLDGNIYFSGFFHNYLGQYNPKTHEFRKFVLPKPRHTHTPLLESGFPWDIELDPTTGDILMTDYWDEQIVRFQTNKERDNLCHIEKLSSDQSAEIRGSHLIESCIIEYEARPAGFAGPAATHSLDIDLYGNVWFTTNNYIGVIPKGEREASFRKISGKNILTEALATKDQMTGIRVNTKTGDVWVASFRSREVYYLTPNR